MRMDDPHILILCPQCRQQLRLPDTPTNKSVRCPKCRLRFGYQPGRGVVEKGPLSLNQRLGPKALVLAGVAVFIGLPVVVALTMSATRSREPDKSPDPKPATSTSLKSTPAPFAAQAPEDPKPSKPGRPDRPAGLITWRIGTVSPRFGVSERELQKAIERATHLWEDAAGMNLFLQDSNGFPIDLVYDHRQELWNAKSQAERELQALKGLLSQADKRFKEARARLDKAERDFEAQQGAFEDRLRDYNGRVADVNVAGGASPADRAALDDERNQIESERLQLARSQGELQGLQADVDDIIRRRNARAEDHNEAVSRFNAKYGKTELRLGECVTSGIHVEHIRVFAFSDKDHLAIVLAHEFGHALGLPHVAGDGHLMSAVEKGRKSTASLRLTTKDKAALTRILR